VFCQHGTGDSRLCKHPDDAVTAALGVKLAKDRDLEKRQPVSSASAMRLGTTSR
jgi:hypothetical protein